MAQLDISIQFEATDFYGGVARLDPGSMVRGQVKLEPREAIGARGVRLRLRWYTAGRGDTDSQIVEEVELAQGDLRARIPLEADFSFSLPDEPWSYAGHYINIIWSLEVIVDIPFGRDIVHRERLIMAPARLGLGERH